MVEAADVYVDLKSPNRGMGHRGLDQVPALLSRIRPIPKGMQLAAHPRSRDRGLGGPSSVSKNQARHISGDYTQTLNISLKRRTRIWRHRTSSWSSLPGSGHGTVRIHGQRAPNY